MRGSFWGPVAVVSWLATRAVVVALYLGPHAWVAGDVGYYAASLGAAGDLGLAGTLVEYPLPAVALLALPWLVTGALGFVDAYATLVLCLALATDAAFATLLARYADAKGRVHAVTAWVLAVPLLGATALARFDLVPGVLAGAGLLLLGRHPRVAAAAAGLATGVKLWPFLVLPALAAPLRTRRRVTATVAAVGVVLVAGSALVAGPVRLVSPLTWQGERGLQVESVLATPAMIGWALDPSRFAVAYTDHNAFEVTGPGVDLLLAGARLLSVLLVAGLAALWLRTVRAGSTGEGVAWVCLAAVTAFVVTSKVLSPQYLLWLLPLAAAGLAVAWSRRLVVWTAGLLVATALTQLVFPVLYGGVVGPQPWSGWVVLVLAVRNVLLVWLLADAVSAAWRSSATLPDRRRAASAPSGGAPTTPP